MRKLLVLMFVNWRGPGVVNIFLAIGIIGWVTEARLIRGQFLTLREQDYIKAARVAGANPLYIIGRHLLPNSLTPIIVAATFGVYGGLIAISLLASQSGSTP